LSFAKTQPAWSKSPIHENAPPQLRVRPTSGKKIDAPAMEEKDFLRAAYHSDLDLRSKATDPRVHAVSGVLPCYRFQGLPHGPPRQSAQPIRRGRMIRDIEEECSPLPILVVPHRTILTSRVRRFDSMPAPHARGSQSQRRALGVPPLRQPQQNGRLCTTNVFIEGDRGILLCQAAIGFRNPRLHCEAN
jgi:hypothetical protein